MVKRWSDLILQVRKQMRLTGRAMSFGHLPCLLVMFGTLCLSLFMGAMMNFFRAGSPIPAVTELTNKATMLCWIWGVKLIVKARIAETITKLVRLATLQKRIIKSAQPVATY